MQVKLRAGDRMLPVDVESEANGKHLALSFGYSPALVEEMRGLDLVGSGWQGHNKENPRKVWLARNSARTRFRLDWLKYNPNDRCTGGIKHEFPNGQMACTRCRRACNNPYARYDAKLIEFDERDHEHALEGRRPYYDHQRVEGIPFVLTRRQCILAWEPGAGKTIVAGRAMEWAKDELDWKDEDFWYVCKAGALNQVMLDFDEWKIRVAPKFLSYEAMRGLVERWKSGTPPPKFLVFDESSQIKSATSKRSEAALYLANAVREEHGLDAFVVLMTGSPAPKNPADWWMQCEVACPGFVRQGNYNKFKTSMAIIQQVRDESGGGYPKLISWLDDEKKCKQCGMLEPNSVHSLESRLSGVGHAWQKSVDEVTGVYKRLRGFVVVKFKKDCIDLPKRVYKVVTCKPTQETLNAARLIAKRARTGAQALVLLRELSDGFQYKEEVVDTIKCPDCGSSGTALIRLDPENPDEPISQEALLSGRLIEGFSTCDRCRGGGEVDVTERVAAKVACPKDDVMLELLEEHDDVGRLVTYAGFTGSVDRVVDVHLRSGWSVLRVDGRGWVGMSPQGAPELPKRGKDLYSLFRYGQREIDKMAFVAQASTAAHGLNFDCCPTEVFYSNDFNFESRIQAEERNNRGAIAATLRRTGREHITVVDIVHLESDRMILKNHKAKRKHQLMTLGEVQSAVS